MHKKREWKEKKLKPPTDTTLEEFKKESRFKPPTIPSQEMLEEEKGKYTVEVERRLKAEFDKAQQQAQKTKEAYEQMLKEKKSTLKPTKKPQEDSSSEEQRVRQKKIEDSSSSEIPKRRNFKPRCIMIRLRSAREVAEEGERPVLTERREDAPIATPEVEAKENDESKVEKTTEETSSSTTVAMKERSQGIYASEASSTMTLEEMFDRQREEERNTPEYQRKQKGHTKKVNNGGLNVAE